MSAWGAFIGLLVSIFLIIRKISPVYSRRIIRGSLVAGNGLFNDQWSK